MRLARRARTVSSSYYYRGGLYCAHRCYPRMLTALAKVVTYVPLGIRTWICPVVSEVTFPRAKSRLPGTFAPLLVRVQSLDPRSPLSSIVRNYCPKALIAHRHLSRLSRKIIDWQSVGRFFRFFSHAFNRFERHCRPNAAVTRRRRMTRGTYNGSRGSTTTLERNELPRALRSRELSARARPPFFPARKPRTLVARENPSCEVAARSHGRAARSSARNAREERPLVVVVVLVHVFVVVLVIVGSHADEDDG